MLTLVYLEAKNNIYWSFDKVLFKNLSELCGWRQGSGLSRAESCSWGWGEEELEITAECCEARGAVGDSVNWSRGFL